MLGLSGAPVSGVVVFAGIGLLAGALFIVIANRKGDHTRMVAEHRQLRVGSRT